MDKKTYLDELGEDDLRSLAKRLFSFTTTLAETPLSDLVSKENIRNVTRDLLRELKEDYDE